MTTEKELIKATKFKTKSTDRQQTLLELATAVQDLSDDQWEELSEPARKWANNAADAIDGGTDVPDFGPEEQPKPKAKPLKKKTTKAAAVRVDDDDDLPKLGSMVEALSLIVRNNPKLSKKEMVEQLRKAGYDPTEYSVGAYSHHFKVMMKTLQKCGDLKRDMI